MIQQNDDGSLDPKALALTELSTLQANCEEKGLRVRQAQENLNAALRALRDAESESRAAHTAFQDLKLRALRDGHVQLAYIDHKGPRIEELRPSFEGTGEARPENPPKPRHASACCEPGGEPVLSESMQ